MYGVFELGYTSICLYSSKTEANKACKELNTKILKRKKKGEIKETVIFLNKYYVKEIK